MFGNNKTMKALYTNRVWAHNTLTKCRDKNNECDIINYLYKGTNKPNYSSNEAINDASNEAINDADEFTIDKKTGYLLADSASTNPDVYALIYHDVNYIDEDGNQTKGNYYRKIYSV